MSTTVQVSDRTNNSYRLETAPGTKGSGWEQGTYTVDNTSVGPGNQVPAVTLNRDIGIEDGKTYYMQTKVLTAEGTLICSLWERLVGTWLDSDMAVMVEAGDDHATTGWLTGHGSLTFKLPDGDKYGVQVNWIPSAGFDDVVYVLSGGPVDPGPRPSRTKC